MKEFPFWANLDNAETGGHNVRIHRSSCSDCNGGLGRKQEGRDPGIRWIPFERYEDAYYYGARMLSLRTAACQRCRPDAEESG